MAKPKKIPSKKTKRSRWTKKKNLGWKGYLKQIYYNPKHPASFQGANKLYDAVKKDNKYTIDLDHIKEWLQDQVSYSINKAVKRKFKRNKVIVTGIDDQFDADLMSMRQYANDNDGIEYILAVIDVFSRHGWMEPLINKTAKDVISGFENIFSEGRIPRRVRSDRGSEFTAKETQKYLKNKGISTFFTNNEKQANYVERFIRTIKSKIRRYMRQQESKKYIDVLQDFVRSYNSTFHSGIKETPNNVNKYNEKKIWWETYWPSEEFNRKKAAKVKKGPKFLYNIGDLVRISHLRNTFQREYDQRWSGEIYKIQTRFARQQQPLYTIEDFKGERITGSFYESELQRVHLSPDAVYEIETVLKEKTSSNGEKLFLVKYKHWPKKFNEWIKESQLVKS